jgi:hypothetical protein
MATQIGKREPTMDIPAERWGSPEFHKRQLDIQQEEQQARRALSYEQQEVQDPQEHSDAWNNWCDHRIADFLNSYTDTLIPMVFTRIEKAKQAADTELNQLKTEVAELRGEVNLLRELLKGRKDIA